LKIEESLKVVKILGLIFHLESLVVEVSDSVVSVVDNLNGGLIDVVWARLLELDSEFGNLLLEVQ
jgi:hypothetical protein